MTFLLFRGVGIPPTSIFLKVLSVPVLAKEVYQLGLRSNEGLIQDPISIARLHESSATPKNRPSLWVIGYIYIYTFEMVYKNFQRLLIDHHAFTDAIEHVDFQPKGGLHL